MKDKYLLKGETVYSSSSDNTVTLTNYRLRYQSAKSNEAHIVSIMLEKISSIEVHHKSNLTLLYLGVVAILAGFFGAYVETMFVFGGLLVGAIFIMTYMAAKKHVVSVKSDGGTSIDFEVKGMKLGAILDFVNEIEEAKREVSFSRDELSHI